MKFVIFLTLLALAAAEQYSTENDNFDVEKFVKNSAEVKAFVECFLDKGPCDYISADFKKDLSEAVKEACAKCTPAQKHIFKRFLEELKKNHASDYAALQDKYDSDKKYFAPLEAAIANA